MNITPNYARREAARQLRSRLTWAAIFVASLLLSYGFGCVSQAAHDEARMQMEEGR